jgi:hypothetical protein
MASKIVWTCDVCGKQADANKGWVHSQRLRDAGAEWEQFDVCSAVCAAKGVEGYAQVGLDVKSLLDAEALNLEG